jgi:8-oxo-dGTP pyrophosphatase MutT (NUDIX family)
MSDFYRRIRERLGSSLLLMPAVAALVRDREGRFLVHQRPDGSWSLPAGAVEPGETPAQAIVREVHEETGLVVCAERIAGIVGGSSCRVRYQNGDEVESVVTVFDCTAVGGELLQTGDETDERAHQELGQKLLAKYADTPDLQRTARETVAKVLEIAAAGRAQAAQRLGTACFPGC